MGSQIKSVTIALFRIVGVFFVFVGAYTFLGALIRTMILHYSEPLFSVQGLVVPVLGGVLLWVLAKPIAEQVSKDL